MLALTVNTRFILVTAYMVPTNLEHLEYCQGISLNVENSGIIEEFCATSEKIVTN